MMELRRIRRDLTGTRIGHLRVLERLPSRLEGQRPQPKVYYRCQCDCGTLCEVRAHNLVPRPSHARPNTQSCGRCHFARRGPKLGSRRGARGPRKDLTGARFGHFVVLRRGPWRRYAGGMPAWTWVCRCDQCGAEVVLSTGNLHDRAGRKTCGCDQARVMRASVGQLFLRMWRDRWPYYAKDSVTDIVG